MKAIFACKSIAVSSTEPSQGNTWSGGQTQKTAISFEGAVRIDQGLWDRVEMTSREFMALNPAKDILIFLYHLFLFTQLVGTVCSASGMREMLCCRLGLSLECTRERDKMLMHSSRSTDPPLDSPWFSVWDFNFITHVNLKTLQYFLPEVLWLFTLSWWAVKHLFKKPYHNKTAASPFKVYKI